MFPGLAPFFERNQTMADQTRTCCRFDRVGPQGRGCSADRPERTRAARHPPLEGQAAPPGWGRNTLLAPLAREAKVKTFRQQALTGKNSGEASHLCNGLLPRLQKVGPPEISTGTISLAGTTNWQSAETRANSRHPADHKAALARPSALPPAPGLLETSENCG